MIIFQKGGNPTCPVHFDALRRDPLIVGTDEAIESFPMSRPSSGCSDTIGDLL